MSFAENLKQVRNHLCLTQEELAHKLGVSFATVNRWENGSYNPSRLAKKTFENSVLKINRDYNIKRQNCQPFFPSKFCELCKFFCRFPYLVGSDFIKQGHFCIFSKFS